MAVSYESTERAIADALGQVSGVQTAAVVGSRALASANRDDFSDLDVFVVASEQVAGVFLHPDWWAPRLGRPLGVSRSANCLRLAFADLRRVDLALCNALPPNAHTLFSGEAGESACVSMAAGEPQLADEFYFAAVLAISKIARDDLLIGLHLALDLLRQCLVVSMMLRDRDAGTNHHRRGGPYNETAAELERCWRPHNHGGVLTMVEKAAAKFDQLYVKLDAHYAPRSQHLKRWLLGAHEALETANYALR